VSTIVGGLFRILILPVRLVILLLRLIARAGLSFLSVLFGPVLKRIDSSEGVSNWVDFLSSSMATQRGLPLMIGTALLVLSALAHALVLIFLVSTSDFSRNLYLLCIPFGLLHIGILAGFTGAMLAVPLGQGYKDK
jgi:hypothetical protein